MFDALVNGRVDRRGLDFDVRFADIEQLNLTAMRGGADICKVSYGVLPAITERYAVADSGSALGHGNGPLLVARGDIPALRDGSRIAVPGFNTTANLLMGRLFPEIIDKSEILFSEIAGRVSSGEFDAGVLIHEGRFTYRAHGLRLIADLGAEWERLTSLPLPLGAIAVSRSLPRDVAGDFDEVLRASIEYAFANPGASRDFVRSYARELDDGVIESHIRLFVNDYSLSLGSSGRRAVRELTGITV